LPLKALHQSSLFLKRKNITKVYFGIKRTLDSQKVSFEIKFPNEWIFTIIFPFIKIKSILLGYSTSSIIGFYYKVWNND
jgi:hypothetical protein